MKQRHPSLKPVPRPDAEQVHQILYPYGVGVDTHSKFIQVCVLLTPQTRTRSGDIIRKEKEFATDWRSLQRAADWAFGLLPKGTDRTKMRYCIESTGTYHLPVLRAWAGIPCVVNPLLAGPMPANPQTSSQMRVRGIFATNARAWDALTEAQRTAWIAAAASPSQPSPSSVFGPRRTAGVFRVWLVVLAYQLAAFDSHHNWQLSRAALDRLEARSEHRR